MKTLNLFYALNQTCIFWIWDEAELEYKFHIQHEFHIKIYCVFCKPPTLYEEVGMCNKVYSSEGKWKYIYTCITYIIYIYISSRYISCQARTKFIGFILPIFRSFDSLLQDKILTLFCQNFIMDCYKNRLSQYKSFQRHLHIKTFCWSYLYKRKWKQKSCNSHFSMSM